MRLGDAAEVRSGLVLARKSSRTPTPHCYPLLNLRSIKDDGYIDLEDLDIFHATEALQSDYISQVGDIVIRLSAPYTAVLIDGETAGMVVSSNFAIVRADRQQIIPSYLYWLLNTPKVKKRIYENTTSNMLAAIKPMFFSDFNIVPLPLEKQRIIGEMNLLRRRETALLRKLADERNRYTALLIDKAQKEMRRSSDI